MGTLAWLLGILSGLCTVMSILIATEVVPAFITGGAVAISVIPYNVYGWGGLAVILLLGCIATLIARRGL